MRVAIAIAAVAMACGGDGTDTGGVDAGDAPDAAVAPDAAADGQVETTSDATPPPDASGLIPPGALRVFVSSQRYPADLRSAGGQSTGRESADALCQNLADASSLGGTWRAWLSTTDRDAIDHVRGQGPWYRLDGVLLFPNRAALTTQPSRAISIDERGGIPDPFFETWTGTAIGGRVLPPGERQSVTCVDWTSTIDTAELGGLLGHRDERGGASGAWTQGAVGRCGPFRRHLYCFEG